MNPIAFFILVNLSVAQTCSSATGNALTTFNQCIRNGLVDINGQVGPTNANDACAGAIADQPKYYDCLCKRYSSIVDCYNFVCPRDISIPSYEQSKTQFCQAAQNVVVPSATVGSTLPPINYTPKSTPTSSVAPSTKKETSTAIGQFMSFSLIFGEVLALICLTNLV